MASFATYRSDAGILFKQLWWDTHGGKCGVWCYRRLQYCCFLSLCPSSAGFTSVFQLRRYLIAFRLVRPGNRNVCFCLAVQSGNEFWTCNVAAHRAISPARVCIRARYDGSVHRHQAGKEQRRRGTSEFHAQHRLKRWHIGGDNDHCATFAISSNRHSGDHINPYSTQFRNTLNGLTQQLNHAGLSFTEAQPAGLSQNLRRTPVASSQRTLPISIPIGFFRSAAPACFCSRLLW